MSFFRNAIAMLYNTVSTPVSATRDALAERLQSVRETVSLLYRKTKERLGYGEALRATVEDTAKEEEDLTPQDIMLNIYLSLALSVLSTKNDPG